MDIPNYSIDREIGHGGMATVYLARHQLLKRQVALKVMSPEFSSGKTFQDAFMREGQVVAQLEHPNIVRIYDIGIANGSTFYMAMEYLGGGNLRERLGRESPTLESVVQIMRQVGAGLDYAHRQGIIHRDIKPENILFRQDGTAVLTDFGIAKVQDSIGEMTRMGYTAGTAQYMSPEQAAADKLDYRSDLYSLGLVVFEMLSGEKVCKADSMAQAIYQHTSVPPPKLPGQYQLFQPIMHKALAKQPEQRYPSVKEFVDVFASKANELRRQAPPPLAAMPRGDTRIFTPAPTEMAPAAVPAAKDFPSSKSVTTEPVFIRKEQENSSFWKKPLLITSVVGAALVGLVFLIVVQFPTNPPNEPTPQNNPPQSTGNAARHCAPAPSFNKGLSRKVVFPKGATIVPINGALLGCESDFYKIRAYKSQSITVTDSRSGMTGDDLKLSLYRGNNNTIKSSRDLIKTSAAGKISVKLASLQEPEDWNDYILEVFNSGQDAVSYDYDINIPKLPEAAKPKKVSPPPQNVQPQDTPAPPQVTQPNATTYPDGEKIYRSLCFSCHDTGVANAPKLGDRDSWRSRIATGKNALYASALNGKNAMPRKGGNPALSDDEVKAAVDWMVSQGQ
ncbi:protein kinase [Candidatus Thiothrix sp. Deng01]|uniref:Protein kinase n=1 Tax=Candidatus Thiothrix phosphatis TaxID=3112415 RepID=A0ABU6CWR5_9GAMM|nr:protein kinase [Candidatus Thiothrix sp. Deng01]MEB4591281.1 protein kinase [Candidatus Thiothrix sp. Deng01]